MSARDDLALEIFIGDNSNQSRKQSIVDWEWFHETARFRSRIEHYEVMADAILAAGYRKPRTITTVEEIRELPALTIVVYDDTATGGLLQTYVVPDDGTVMFKDREPFHLMTFAGDYVDAEDMPLPLTAVYEVTA